MADHAGRGDGVETTREQPGKSLSNVFVSLSEGDTELIALDVSSVVETGFQGISQIHDRILGLGWKDIVVDQRLQDAS
ncbi:MAG: hypothetical protein ABEI52_12135, partial [Halobacteriaceae archaeon]